MKFEILDTPPDSNEMAEKGFYEAMNAVALPADCLASARSILTKYAGFFNDNRTLRINMYGVPTAGALDIAWTYWQLNTIADPRATLGYWGYGNTPAAWRTFMQLWRNVNKQNATKQDLLQHIPDKPNIVWDPNSTLEDGSLGQPPSNYVPLFIVNNAMLDMWAAKHGYNTKKLSVVDEVALGFPPLVLPTSLENIDVVIIFDVDLLAKRSQSGTQMPADMGPHSSTPFSQPYVDIFNMTGDGVAETGTWPFWYCLDTNNMPAVTKTMLAACTPEHPHPLHPSQVAGQSAWGPGCIGPIDFQFLVLHELTHNLGFDGSAGNPYEFPTAHVLDLLDCASGETVSMNKTSQFRTLRRNFVADYATCLDNWTNGIARRIYGFDSQANKAKSTMGYHFLPGTNPSSHLYTPFDAARNDMEIVGTPRWPIWDCLGGAPVGGDSVWQAAAGSDHFAAYIMAGYETDIWWMSGPLKTTRTAFEQHALDVSLGFLSMMGWDINFAGTHVHQDEDDSNLLTRAQFESDFGLKTARKVVVHADGCRHRNKMK